MDRLSLPGATVEVRAAGDGAPRALAGYAALFGVPSSPIRGEGGPAFVEVIRRGAFARAIAEAQDVRALWNHDPALVLGRTGNGTLALSEDERGLAFTVTPPDTQWARDLVTLVERGDVSQCSFAFAARDDDWSVRDGQHLRELRDVALYDVGPVTFPAYGATSVAVRSTARVPRHLLRPEDGRGSRTWALARLRAFAL